MSTEPFVQRFNVREPFSQPKVLYDREGVSVEQVSPGIARSLKTMGAIHSCFALRIVSGEL